jgi:hypothetical protein
MNRRNALFAPSRDFGPAKTLPGNGPRRRRPEPARFASLTGTCKPRGAEPRAHLRDLFTKPANRRLDKNIDALTPWTCITKPATSK